MLFLYIRCGQKKKHPEHFEEIRTLTKRCKQLKQEIEILKQDKQNLVAFESKSISAFTTGVTNRLIKAFPDRYNPRSAIGKIKLQKDILLRFDWRAMVKFRFLQQLVMTEINF